jgi:hypothetical protein
MKAYEIPVRVTEEGNIELPEALLASLPRRQTLRVIILVPEPADQEEDAAWSNVAAAQFLAGYSKTDSIYDKA